MEVFFKRFHSCTNATKLRRGKTGTQPINRNVSGGEFQAEKKSVGSQDQTSLVILVQRVQARVGAGAEVAESAVNKLE